MLAMDIHNTGCGTRNPAGVHPSMAFTPIPCKNNSRSIIQYMLLVFLQTPYYSQKQASLSFHEPPRER